MLRRLLVALVACWAVASTAGAATIAFTDRAAWLAAVGNPVTTIDFEGLAPIGGSTAIVPDLVVSGTHFGRASVSDPGVGVFISGWGSGATLFSYGTVEPGVITFPGPVTAFGFDFGATACYFVTPCPPGGVTVNLSSGAVLTGASPTTVLHFIGLISTDPLTSASLSISPTFGIVDNVSFGTARVTAVPEPAFGVLLVIGVGLSRNRWRSGS